MHFSLVGALALAAGSASAQGLFDFEKPKPHTVLRRAGEVQFDSCGIPLRANWSRHGKYARNGHSNKKRPSCEMRRANYIDQSALGPMKQETASAAPTAEPTSNDPAAPTTWASSQEASSWSSQQVKVAAFGQQEASSEAEWSSSAPAWTSSAAATEAEPWTSSAVKSAWSSSQPESSAWSSSSEEAWSSSSPEWSASSSSEWAPTTSTEAWSSSAEPTTTTQWSSSSSVWSSSAPASSSSESSSPQAFGRVRIANNAQQPASSDSGDGAWDSSNDATTTTAAAVASPAPVISSGNSYGKRGLAWAVDDRWAPTIASDKISWAYHWQDGVIHTMPSNTDFYPMLYGGTPANIAAFQAVMAEMSGGLPSHILGPNEPDIPSQSNMSPQAAAAVWKQYMEPYADQGVQLCTPATAWKLDWLQEFMDACTDCRVSCLAVHSYDSYDPDFAALKTRIEQYHGAFPELDIWVTEYGLTSASNPSADDVVQYLEATTAYFDSADYIKKYAFFGAWAVNPDGFASSNSAFFDYNGGLSTVGNWYRNN